nr:hypothetical protein [Bacillaceae bacterium]
MIQFSSFDFPIISADHPPSSKIRAKISALAEKSLPFLLAAYDETNSEINPFYRNFFSFPQSPDFSETCPFPPCFQNDRTGSFPKPALILSKNWFKKR